MEITKNLFSFDTIPINNVASKKSRLAYRYCFMACEVLVITITKIYTKFCYRTFETS